MIHNNVRMMSLHLMEPQVNLMVFENIVNHKNRLQIPSDLINKKFLPTMYQSWTNPQTEHLQFEPLDILYTHDVPSEVLFIFDTWGCSSYYHLLIDHLIPLWITRSIVGQWLGFDPEKSSCQYLRISNNNTTTELPNIDEIFNHIFGRGFSAVISGSFKYVVYGYCYSYRPFHSLTQKTPYFDNYKYYLDNFVNTFSLARGGPFEVLFPVRSVRNNPFVNFFYDRYKQEFNFRRVDLGKITFKEQIQICGSASCMFGSEGAAFANQVFMPKGSLIICINHIPIFGFQSTIADYMEHDFHGYVVVDQHEYEEVGSLIATLMRNAMQ